MMELKFRYVWKSEKTIATRVYTLKEVANGSVSAPSVMNDGAGTLRCWELIAVDQFTGLHDKNGVMIFEGDLMKNPSGRVCAVTWCEHEASFDCEPISPVTGDSDYSENHHWKWHMEVIGNIYQEALNV